MWSKLKQILGDSFRIGQKELLELRRDRMRFAMLIIMPIFLMVMMSYIFPTQGSLQDLPLGVVNQDEGEYGVIIVDSLSQMGSFDIVELDSADEAKGQIREGKINGAVVIPEDFSAMVMAEGEQGSITIINDQSNPQIAMMLGSMLGGIMDGFSTKKGIEQLMAPPYELTREQAQALVKPIVTETENVPPGETNYFEFMAPGVMAMVAMLAVMMGMAVSVAEERELGTLDGILVAPINRLSIILGKTFSQAVRGLMQAMIILILAIALFGVVIHGSIPLVILLLLLGIFSFMGLGILISTLSSKQETAMTIMMTIQFPMIFLCGAFFPVEQMPSFMQGISKAIPLTYAVDALRKVIVLGAGIPDITTELIVLVVSGAVLLAIAIPLFNRATTR